jgi:hypothetical protein
MKRTALCCLLLLAGCGPEPETKREKAARKEAAQPPMPELEPPAPRAKDARAGGGAAAILRTYYSRIEAGDYDAAWAMRSGGDEAARRRFAENFRAYQSYRAEVGRPSEPVESQGWLFVEVPVMITGAFRGGKAFASAGSVTLRRATTADATPLERDWHIFTGERRARK